MVKAEKHKKTQGGEEYITHINCESDIDEMRCFGSIISTLAYEIDNDSLFAIVCVNSQDFLNCLKRLVDALDEAQKFFNA